MWVIDVVNAPPRLRGRLSRWAVEARAGLYVGSTSSKMRDAIWEIVLGELTSDMSAVIAFPSTGPQGFEIRTCGENRREIVELEGMTFAVLQPLLGDAMEPEHVDDASLEFDPSEFDPEYLEP